MLTINSLHLDLNRTYSCFLSYIKKKKKMQMHRNPGLNYHYSYHYYHILWYYYTYYYCYMLVKNVMYTGRRRARVRVSYVIAAARVLYDGKRVVRARLRGDHVGWHPFDGGRPIARRRPFFSRARGSARYPCEKTKRNA